MSNQRNIDIFSRDWKHRNRQLGHVEFDLLKHNKYYLNLQHGPVKGAARWDGDFVAIKEQRTDFAKLQKRWKTTD